MSRTAFILAIGLGLLAAPGCTSENPEAVSRVAEVVTEVVTQAEVKEKQPFQPPAVPGSLVFETKEVELGNVLQHHEYEVRYPFTVVGEGPVRFHDIELDHGMVRAHLEAPFPMGEWIPLGTQGEIVATFDAGRYIGNMGSRVSLSGDFESNREDLRVQMFIIPVFEMDPAIVQFGSIRKEELQRGDHSQVVRVTGLKDFEILRWKRTPPGVSMEELEGKETRRDGRVVCSFLVTPGPDMPKGRMSSSFIAETSLGVELEFMVNAEVIGNVRYTPSSRVAFGILDQGKEKRRSVKVEAVDPYLVLPLPTVTVEGDAAKVVVAEVRTVIEDRQYGITLNIGKLAPPGSYNGVLRITYPEALGLAPKEIMLNARIRSFR